MGFLYSDVTKMFKDKANKYQVFQKLILQDKHYIFHTKYSFFI